MQVWGRRERENSDRNTGLTVNDFRIFAHPRTGHEGLEGDKQYSSTLSLTSALDGVGGLRHAPAALSRGKTRYPLYRRLGGPQGRSVHVRKISPPPRFDPRTVQPVARISLHFIHM
jgi:hypothetical protein